ncbi:FAD-binding oxidoreductase [Micromonospora sp. M12]
MRPVVPVPSPTAAGALPARSPSYCARASTIRPGQRRAALTAGGGARRLAVPVRATGRGSRHLGGRGGALMAGARQAGVPLTLRGGGTSLAGQAGGAGVLVDVRTDWRDAEVLDDGRRIRLQPGLTIRQANARLACYRRRLGPDPASEAACTVGGMVANNSSGMTCGTTDNAYRTMESLRFVLRPAPSSTPPHAAPTTGCGPTSPNCTPGCCACATGCAPHRVARHHRAAVRDEEHHGYG